MRGAGSGGGAAGPGCGNCGSQDLETIRPGWVESLGTWLRSRGRWPSSQVCRRCGHVTPAGSIAYLAPRKGWGPVPARGLRRERQELAERFRASPFPLYGLPASWTGPRHLGGMGSRQARGQPPLVTSLTLAHGDPAAGHGPELRVEVRSDPDDPGTGPELRQALAVDLRWAAASLEDREAEAERGGPGGRPADQADPLWSTVPLPVDGQPVTFDLLAEGRHWVAMAEVEGRALVLQARDLAPEQVELVRVTDVEPYVDGTERLEEAWARRGRNDG
jgi:hypothetical protein